MRLLHEYPANTPLYFEVAEKGPGKVQPVLPYPLQVWYDPVEVVPMPLDLPGLAVEAWTIQDDGPRVRPKKVQVLSAVGTSLTMQFQGTMDGEHVRIHVLVDSGATSCFVSQALASKLRKSPVSVNVPPIHVAGGQVAVLGRCNPRLMLQGHHSSPSCFVLPDLPGGFDVILGDQWLREHSARMVL